MKPKIPELLLVIYLVSPFKTAAVSQFILCQIRAIHAANRAKEKLILDLENDTDEAFTEFIRAFWNHSANSEIKAYIGLLYPQSGLLHRPIIEIYNKIIHDQFELSKLAIDRAIESQIRVYEIKDTIANGTIVEEEYNDFNHAGYLICGMTQGRRTIHIQCSDGSRDLIKITSVYEPDRDRWNDNFTMRTSHNNDE